MAAAEEVVNAGPDGVAIDGFDPVAYFTEGRPRKGRAAFAHTHKGVVWRFASAANRDAFAQNPEAFTPAYNGFCAVAASEGAAAEVDFIAGWTIQDGRLFLNWTADTLALFLRERDRRIADADRRWPDLQADIRLGLRQIARHKDFPERGITHPQELPE